MARMAVAAVAKDGADREVEGAGATLTGITPPRCRDWATRWKRKLIYLSLRTTIKLLRRGKNSAALGILERVADFAPNVVVLRLWFARLAMSLGNDQMAMEAIRPEAVDHLPDARRHFGRIAEVYLDLDELAAAERYLHLAKTADPRSPVVWALLGRLFRMRGDTDESVGAYLRSSELESTPSLRIKAIKNAARSLADVGRKDAEHLFDEILKAEPKDPFSYFGIVDCRGKVDLSDPLVDKIRGLIEDRTIPRSNKSHLHYALGIIYDKSGDAGSAFAHLCIANELRAKQGAPLDMEKRRRSAGARRTTFTRELIDRLSQYGCREDVLICVVGMPRSGTTLTEQILGSHSLVRPLGERNDFWRLTRTLPHTLKSNNRYPECCLDITAQQIEETWTTILDRMRRAAGPCQRMVTKLPEDFLEVGLIRILFPKAKFVHTQRNPLDVCWSCFQQNFKHIPYSRDVETLGEAYRIYLEMMRHWRAVLPAASIFDLSYEALVADPEARAREMCDFVGLPFERSCLEYYTREQPVHTMSRWQVKQPIYQSSVNRSSSYREFLGPLLDLANDVPSGQDVFREPQCC